MVNVKGEIQMSSEQRLNEFKMSYLSEIPNYDEEESYELFEALVKQYDLNQQECERMINWAKGGERYDQM